MVEDRGGGGGRGPRKQRKGVVGFRNEGRTEGGGWDREGANGKCKLSRFCRNSKREAGKEGELEGHGGETW